MSETSPHPDSKSALVQLRWPLTVVVVLLGFGLLAFLAYRESLARVDAAGGAVADFAGAAADVAEQIAGSLLSGNVTESFVAAIPQIEGVGGGNLELASSTTTEIFTRSDERRVLWDWVSLGTTVSEVRVPVTYRYHLRLGDEWRIEIQDGMCLVHAPAIRPTQPPAIDTSGLEKRVDADWLRFDAEEQLAELERSITPRLIDYAGDPRHVDLIRETSRRTVAAFVRTWLLREDQWGSGKVRAVKVLFADEETRTPEEIGASLVFRD